MSDTATPQQPTDDQRKQALANAVAREVGNGCRVESQTDFQAVVVKGKRPSHLLHLILSLVTLGAEDVSVLAMPQVRWSDLFGIDPGFTGDLTTDEYLEANRGEA